MPAASFDSSRSTVPCLAFACFYRFSISFVTLPPMEPFNFSQLSVKIKSAARAAGGSRPGLGWTRSDADSAVTVGGMLSEVLGKKEHFIGVSISSHIQVIEAAPSQSASELDGVNELLHSGELQADCISLVPTTPKPCSPSSRCRSTIFTGDPG